MFIEQMSMLFRRCGGIDSEKTVFTLQSEDVPDDYKSPRAAHRDSMCILCNSWHMHM